MNGCHDMTSSLPSLMSEHNHHYDPLAFPSKIQHHHHHHTHDNHQQQWWDTLHQPPSLVDSIIVVTPMSSSSSASFSSSPPSSVSFDSSTPSPSSPPPPPPSSPAVIAMATVAPSPPPSSSSSSSSSSCDDEHEQDTAPSSTASVTKSAAKKSTTASHVKPPSSATTACGICYSHKVRCDGKRPCGRCVRLKRSEKCEDRIIGGPQIHTNGRRGRVPRKPSGLQDTPTNEKNGVDSTAISSSKRKSAVTKRSSTSSSRRSGRGGSTSARSSRRNPAASDDHDTISTTTTHDTTSVQRPSSSSSLLLSSSPTSAEEVVDADGGDMVDAAPSSSSVEFLARSASRSPVRKRDRRSDSSHDNHSISSALVALPPQMSYWNESTVIRQALKSMGPWLVEHMRTHYHPDHIGYNFVSEMLTHRVPRVCPHCISPAQPCASCLQPLTVRRSLGEKFATTFLAGMWVPRDLTIFTSEAFNRLPLAGVSCTLPPPVPGLCGNMTALREHHRFMHEQMTPAWATTEMCLALMASALAPPAQATASIAAATFNPVPSLPSSSSSSSCDQVDAVDAVGVAPTNGHASHAPTYNYNTSAAGCLADKAALRVAAASSSSSSSSWLNPTELKQKSAASGRSLFDELEVMYHTSRSSSSPSPSTSSTASAGSPLRSPPPDGPSSSSAPSGSRDPNVDIPEHEKITPRPNGCFSVNTSLTSMMGWSETAMIQRISTLGFKQDIPLASVKEAQEMFQKTFLSIVGAQNRWAMHAHVINKWQQVIKCLIWGTVQFSPSGYRTCTMFFVPLPGKPLSTNANDPIWTES